MCFFDTYTEAGRDPNNSTTLKAAAGILLCYQQRMEKEVKSGSQAESEQHCASRVRSTVWVLVAGIWKGTNLTIRGVSEPVISPVSYRESMLSVLLHG